MNTTSEIVLIPLNKLTSSSLNVRKTGGQTVDELAASIAAHGLLQNLVVAPAKGDKHQVVAGGRRLAALTRLAKNRVIPKTMGVPCRIVEGKESTEASLAENIVREQMHPADQFDAFNKMVEEGLCVDEVAARFGVTPTSVRQRLKLANVAPSLMALYRAGDINLDQLMALAVTDDHAAQERVWAGASQWQRSADALRRALTQSMVDAGRDLRALFVGVEAYANAGGHIERDLFTPEHEGYCTDVAKLEELAALKLEQVAEAVRAEGWSWIEILPLTDVHDTLKYGRIYSERVPVEPEVHAEIDALVYEQEQMRQRFEEGDEVSEDVEERSDAIETRLEELNDRRRAFAPEQMQFAGATICLGHKGQPIIDRGLVRPEDKKKLKAAATGGTPGTHGEHSDGEESDEEALSAALVEDLTAQRTAALRAMVATRPDIALVAVTHKLALLVCYRERDYYNDQGKARRAGSALSLSSEKGGCQLDSHAKGINAGAASVRLEQIRSQWVSRIPAEADELWQWLLGQEQVVALDLLAFCVGESVHAVRLNHSSPSDPTFVAAGELAQAVQLDMADWWTVTGESYLGRVKKDQILAAIQEATGETNLESLGKLKKGELVAEAEKRLAGTRWLPEILK